MVILWSEVIIGIANKKKEKDPWVSSIPFESLADAPPTVSDFKQHASVAFSFSLKNMIIEVFSVLFFLCKEFLSQTYMSVQKTAFQKHFKCLLYFPCQSSSI